MDRWMQAGAARVHYPRSILVRRRPVTRLAASREVRGAHCVSPDGRYCGLDEIWTGSGVLPSNVQSRVSQRRRSFLFLRSYGAVGRGRSYTERASGRGHTKVMS